MEILTDAAFTNVEITDRLIFRDETFIDSERNINAKTVKCDFLSCRNIHIEDAVVNDPENFLNLTRNTPAVTGVPGVLEGPKDFNEPLGDHAACVGGQYNEALGKDSVTVGGQENQASGESSIAMGHSAFAKHDNSLVFNTGSEPIESTAARQCLFASEGGLLFKLPKSHDMQTHMVPEGYACWCWDPVVKQVIMKTKQNGVFYKTFLEETKEHELKVALNTEGDTVKMNVINPDHS